MASHQSEYLEVALQKKAPFIARIALEFVVHITGDGTEGDDSYADGSGYYL